VYDITKVSKENNSLGESMLLLTLNSFVVKFFKIILANQIMENTKISLKNTPQFCGRKQ
jgi:hypothetical protein